MPANLHALMPTLGLLAVLGFAVYRRIRRSIGRQAYQPRRLMVRSGFLVLIGGVILTVKMPTLNILTAAALGLVLGAGIGAYALRHTRFEVAGGRIYYTGHPYIGLGVALLFIGRMVYRVLQMPALQGGAMGSAAAGGPPNHDPGAAFAASVSNPLTTATFFLMLGYYLVYSVGILRRRPDPAAVAVTPAQ